ncbi:MAG: asparaginase domain-containing protein [Anaerovoracaceae bacterium]|jgi:L-asparaginase
MKILVIFTGGTIGCGVPDEEGVMGIGDGRYYLIEHFEKQRKSGEGDVEFVTLEPLRTLSENLTIDKWNVLIETMQKSSIEDFDGVIITHGTDTLAWTAALFDRLLLGIKKPVVFVGADYNLYDKRSNGHSNFENAVDFIRNSGLEGAYVIFRNKRGKSMVYPGCQIKQSLTFIDEYDYAFGKVFGYMENGHLIKCSHEKPIIAGIKESDGTITARCSPLLYRIKRLAGEIIIIRPYVGLNYDHIDLDSTRVQAVVHETYHSFTACTEGGDESPYSILYFNKRCRERGIPLYIAPFDEDIVSRKKDRYETADAILGSDIIPLINMSLETAYAQILIDLSMKYVGKNPGENV